MKKDAFYFPHDSNAKDDPKCVMLIEQLGLEGYGIYWILLETLREQPEYRYPVALLPAMARRYNTTTEKMRTVVMQYELFEVDDRNFFSVSLIQRMAVVEAKREQARQAINKRWSNHKGLKPPEEKNETIRTYNERNTNCNTDVIQGKESKVKESKVKESKSKYGEYANVLLTHTEHAKLNTEYSNANELIKFLDEYIEMKGYKAKSHYLAIKKWVVNAMSERQEKKGCTSNKNTNWFNEIGKEEGLW